MNGDELIVWETSRLLAGNKTELQPFGLIKYISIIERHPWSIVLFLLILSIPVFALYNLERLQEWKWSMKMRWWRFKEWYNVTFRGRAESAASSLDLEATRV
mmetsp:Transcript_22928/g.47549  ORF Transcript_22928/g.47549 Transcript_22928/m.47549 type:complete len:102 (-) Transcript_22928:47-352(-)